MSATKVANIILLVGVCPLLSALLVVLIVRGVKRLRAWLLERACKRALRTQRSEQLKAVIERGHRSARARDRRLRASAKVPNSVTAAGFVDDGQPLTRRMFVESDPIPPTLPSVDTYSGHGGDFGGGGASDSWGGDCGVSSGSDSGSCGGSSD